MQTRNLKYNSSGTVDMEIEHPAYGWIPFTASPDDTELYGRELHTAAIAGELGIIAAYVAPVPTSTELKLATQSQIDALERTQLMPRITRESLLILMVSTAASMGLTEPQLYAANIGYSRLKDFDATIVSLRAQMEAIA